MRVLTLNKLYFTVTEAYLHHGKIVKITKEVEDEPGKMKLIVIEMNVVPRSTMNTKGGTEN